MKHKRLSAILSAVLMLPAMLQFSMPASAAKVKTLGDVNADGTVNISDGVALSRYVAKWDGITIDKDAHIERREAHRTEQETDPLHIILRIK